MFGYTPPRDLKQQLLTAPHDEAKRGSKRTAMSFPLPDDDLTSYGIELHDFSTKGTRITASITAMRQLQAKQATHQNKRHLKYSIGMTLAILSLLSLLLEAFLSKKQVSDRFKDTWIPDTNSTCASLYPLEECKWNNTTAMICVGLQKEACNMFSPISIVLAILFMGFMLPSLFVCAKAQLKYNQKDASLDDLMHPHLSEEDKKHIEGLIKECEKFKIDTSKPLNQTVVALEYAQFIEDEDHHSVVPYSPPSISSDEKKIRP